jgi:hypothetical protein
MKKLLIVVILLGAVCGGFATGFLWRDPEILAARQQAANAAASAGSQRETLEASVAELTRERDGAREQSEKLAEQVKDLARRLAESEASAAKGAAALAKATAQARPQPAQGPGGSPMKAMSEMFKTPEMRDAVVQQNLAQMDMIYGKLYARLQLEGADQQDFKNLLSERMRAELEMSIQMMGGGFSPQESSAAAEELKKAKEASDQKIRAFLSHEADYQTFQKWEQTKAERMVLNMGASAFAGTGEPLTVAQEDQLVAAMFAARTQATSVPDMTRPENLTPGNLNPQMTEKLLAAYDSQAAQVVAGAAAYLSPAQVEALKAMQKQQRAMQEMGLKMGASMMGGK